MLVDWSRLYYNVMVRPVSLSQSDLSFPLPLVCEFRDHTTSIQRRVSGAEWGHHDSLLKKNVRIYKTCGIMARPLSYFQVSRPVEATGSSGFSCYFATKLIVQKKNLPQNIYRNLQFFLKPLPKPVALGSIPLSGFFSSNRLLCCRWVERVQRILANLNASSPNIG